MRKIFWIAPSLNHYKIRFLKKLQAKGFDLQVVAGSVPHALGHKVSEGEASGLQVIRVKSDKFRFQMSLAVYLALWRMIDQDRPDAVLLPCEKKYLLILVYLFGLKRLFHYKLVTYTHPLLRSRGMRHQRMNQFVTKVLFSMYDRVIFYTEHAMHQAVGYKLLPAAKAAYANNTLDTDFIKEHYAFTLPPQEARLLFIGRLIPSKRLDLLLEYFYAIKARLPNLKLSIVGDGPESTRILAAAQRDSDIDWKGAIVDEAVIADIMGDCQLVFLPGLSGLSIVHAFCYGRPFVTVSNDNHGPEIVYLKDRWNGLLLEGDLSKDVDRIVDLLGHRRLLEEYSRNAYESAAQLSIHRWCEQIENAFDER